MKFIWALDLSMSCVGLTIFDSNDAKPVLVTSIATKSEDSCQKKLKLIADRILELKELYEPEKIIIESGFTRFNKSTQQLYRVHGLINYLFWDYEQIYYAATTVKKIITGRGNATKEEVKNSVLQTFPSLEFKTDDESDSLALGLVYFKNNSGRLQIDEQAN